MRECDINAREGSNKRGRGLEVDGIKVLMVGYSYSGELTSARDENFVISLAGDI